MLINSNIVPPKLIHPVDSFKNVLKIIYAVKVNIIITVSSTLSYKTLDQNVTPNTL